MAVPAIFLIYVSCQPENIISVYMQFRLTNSQRYLVVGLVLLVGLVGLPG